MTDKRKAYPSCHRHNHYNNYTPCQSCIKDMAVAQGEPFGRAGGLKYDAGKPQWSLLMKGCAKGLAGVVSVLGFGAKKYAADSWKSVEGGKDRYRDALYRHLHALESGEEFDPESGLSHWDHVCCNSLFLSSLYHEAEDK